MSIPVLKEDSIRVVISVAAILSLEPEYVRPSLTCGSPFEGYRPVKPVILVVDDEPALRGMIARTLEAEGFGVVMASDGLEAWGLIEEGNGPFALLLVDLVMPRWDGTTLIRRVKEHQPAQRILVITGRAEPDLLEQVSRQ